MAGGVVIRRDAFSLQKKFNVDFGILPGYLIQQGGVW